MSGSNGKLPAADLDLLEMLGTAVNDDHDYIAFEYLPLKCWPFAWLVHPGLIGEARVVDVDSLARLEEAGCIVFTVDDGKPACRYAMLTYEGMAYIQRRQWHTNQAEPHDR